MCVSDTNHKTPTGGVFFLVSVFGSQTNQMCVPVGFMRRPRFL